MAASTSSTATPTRRLYYGSCHCRNVSYVTYLTLPPVADPNEPINSGTHIYKCNCSTCTKMSIFHVRLIDAPGDFMLLSPLNPTSGGLKDYQCFIKNAHWYFCGTCGVRCFTVAGEGEVREIEIEGEKKQAWMMKREGWDEEHGMSYFSLNAATLEPEQEGFNLKEWTEKGWIAYCDSKDNVGDFRMGKPHDGGMY